MSRLTLPGDIEGLLRRGSPVVALGEEPDADPTVAKFTEYNGFPGAVLGGWCLEQDTHYLCDLALDLEDATGRAHAAWWLAERVGLDGRPYDGDDAPVPVALSAWWLCAWPRSYYVRVPRWDENRRFDHLFSPDSHIGSEGWTHVPALAHLDPTDPRLLPDGSRLVDAEALRLVVLHVAGRS